MATFSEIFGSYRTYREELEEAVEGLRQRSPTLMKGAALLTTVDAKSQAEVRTEDLLRAVKSISKAPTPERTVIEVFIWSSIMVLFANIGVGLGSYVLAPFLPIFLGKVGAMLLGVIGVPIYAHRKIKQTDSSDVTIRNELLSLSIIQGILVGFSISNLYLSSSPFVVFTPLLVTVAFTLISSFASENRALVLGGSIGAAVGANLLLGYITSSLSFTYFLMSLTYAGIAAVTMLHMLKNSQNESKPYAYQNALSNSYIIAKGMFYILFGTYN
ncbi:hypothetical protein OESDEN_09820 [Oesophagostomum dentatum]|uniref:Uncharacterized protein n=1 Tax=Oesophagostomum dentatum TaxID=61180 RepID=A0A0B1T2F3_OESDE|nr:hypothetical protein OESDEN_09820 [Oesophagostomum dentatum]